MISNKALGKAVRSFCMQTETAARAAGAAFTPPPLSTDAAAKSATAMKHAACFGKCSDIIVKEGRGCYVTDVNGKRYLDVTSGIAVLSTGHCHPRVVEAVQKQAANLLHGQLNCFASHEALDTLLDKLGEIMPPSLNRVFMDTTGTQAVEAAVKLARRHTRRPNIITMKGGFHGRSALASAMTSSNSGPRYPLATPLPSGVYYAQPPMAFRWGVSEEDAVKRALASFYDIFRSEAPAETFAAIVAEPILGEGGFLQLPKAYVQELKKFCEENGILFIADEVQAGMGRSGKIWSCEHVDLVPDILVSAKGIASGMPLSMVAGTEEVMACYIPGSHGGTYMGNAVACAAASATLDVMREEGLVQNAERQGALLKGMLTDLQKTYFPHGDVRGPGLMIGMEFHDERGPSPAMAKHVREHCLENGVLIYALSGWDSCTLRIMPPLILKESEAMQIAYAVEESLKSWRAQQHE